MADMLVKLYDIPDDWSFLSNQAALGVTIRKPLGPEKHLVTDWVRGRFGDAWASETDVALGHEVEGLWVCDHRRCWPSRVLHENGGGS